MSEAAPFTTNKIEGARVEFMDGANAGKSAITDAAGNYVIANVNAGGFTVRASANGYNSSSVGVGVTGNLTQNFQLSPSAPRTRFGPGQYRVNLDVAPGRYYSDPVSGCYWERQRGLGGTTADVIANEFIGFNAGQWIVDILSTDLAFEADDECGTWYSTPRRGAQTSISPGMWLVGTQVSPGTYSATTNAGCYWERLRDFTGTLGGIIANDFVSGGGAKLVTIGAGDAGFNTDDDCGQWTRVSTITESPIEWNANPLQSAVEIEQNRMRNREHNPR